MNGEYNEDFFKDILVMAMKDMNQKFEELASKTNPRSLASGSPLAQNVGQFKGAQNDIMDAVGGVLKDHRGDYEKTKSGYFKR
jgi:hypothetical protein